MEHHHDADAAMEDAPLGSSVAEFEDATEIECALWNALIGGCKDALPALHSSDDDEHERGQEHQGDARMFDDFSFSGISFSGTLHESDSNPAECSGQGNEEQHTELESSKAIKLLAHNVDPYKDAVRNDPDGGFHAFLASKLQSFDPNIPHDEVCIYFTCLFNFKLVLYLLVNTFCLPQLFVSIVFFI